MREGRRTGRPFLDHLASAAQNNNTFGFLLIVRSLFTSFPQLNFLRSSHSFLLFLSLPSSFLSAFLSPTARHAPTEISSALAFLLLTDSNPHRQSVSVAPSRSSVLPPCLHCANQAALPGLPGQNSPSSRRP